MSDKPPPEKTSSDSKQPVSKRSPKLETGKVRPQKPVAASATSPKQTSARGKMDSATTNTSTNITTKDQATPSIQSLPSPATPKPVAKAKRSSISTKQPPHVSAHGKTSPAAADTLATPSENHGSAAAAADAGSMRRITPPTVFGADVEQKMEQIKQALSGTRLNSPSAGAVAAKVKSKTFVAEDGQGSLPPTPASEREQFLTELRVCNNSTTVTTLSPASPAAATPAAAAAVKVNMQSSSDVDLDNRESRPSIRSAKPFNPADDEKSFSNTALPGEDEALAAEVAAETVEQAKASGFTVTGYSKKGPLKGTGAAASTKPAKPRKKSSEDKHSHVHAAATTAVANGNNAAVKSDEAIAATAAKIVANSVASAKATNASNKKRTSKSIQEEDDGNKPNKVTPGNCKINNATTASAKAAIDKSQVVDGNTTDPASAKGGSGKSQDVNGNTAAAAKVTKTTKQGTSTAAAKPAPGLTSGKKKKKMQVTRVLEPKT